MSNKKILLFLLGFLLLCTGFCGIYFSFKCAASFLSGALFCSINVFLIYWAWVRLLGQKKLAIWSGFLVLKYGLIFLGLYMLLPWMELSCFSSGLILQGLIMIVVMFFKKQHSHEEKN